MNRYVIDDVINSPYINGGLLRDNVEVYLLCQVKPDCKDIKHMSHISPL